MALPLPVNLVNNTPANADDVMSNFNRLALAVGGLQRGALINGKISVTVASNNLTVAIKTLSGNNPSATDPVYCRIGDTLRPITSALSVTANAGTNWFNAGGSELATKEVDYFAYLGYNATDGVVIGFSRIVGNQYSDFSATSTNSKYNKISTITTAASTDPYEVVGRFAATLSAGAGYTWTVPTYSPENLIQRPIYETRLLDWVPVWTGYSVDPSGGFKKYRLKNNQCTIYMGDITNGTSNANTNKFTVPFASLLGSDARVCPPVYGVDNGGNLSNPPRLSLDSTNTFGFQKDGAGNVWTTSGGKLVQLYGFIYEV